MSTTEILRREHDIVLLKLDALEGAAGNGDFDRVRAMLPFFENEIQLHRRKEEEVLFPLLARYMGETSGPIACMLHEHQEEKELVRMLRSAVDDVARARGEDAQPEVLRRAGDFVAFLRNHIRKENEVLFPMAEQVLSDEEKEQTRTGMSRIGACCDTCAGHPQQSVGLQ